jgi:hypothetical protein
MPSSGMICHVVLVRTDISEEYIASFIEFLGSELRLLVTTNVIISLLILVTLVMVIRSSEMSVLTRATWRNIPENGILHSLVPQKNPSVMCVAKFENLMVLYKLYKSILVGLELQNKIRNSYLDSWNISPHKIIYVKTAAHC